MFELSIFEKPTPDEVLGPLHYPFYQYLVAKQSDEWENQQQILTPIIQSLADRLQPLMGNALSIVYTPPEGHYVTDSFGYGAHLFFLRLPKDSQAMKALPRLMRRRTAVTIAVYDLSAPWGGCKVEVAVTKSLRQPIRDKVLALAVEYVRQRIITPAGTQYRATLGFHTNIGSIDYSRLRTRLLQW